jgi:phosphatidyl-myo-inositol dimannoside synthase
MKDRQAREMTHRPAAIPALLHCTVTREPGHGGIARVSSLVWQVMESLYPGSCELLEAAAKQTDSISLSRKIAFCSTAVRKQLSGQCDLLFFDHLGLARVQSIIPAQLRRPYGIFLHSIEAWNSLSSDRLRTLVQAKVRVANSHYTAARIAAAHPEVGPIDVCQLTLGEWTESPGQTPSKQSACGAQEDVLARIRPASVLVVGRMMKSERHKGHDELIRAWPLVQQKVPGAQLVVVGRGDDVPRLQAATRQNGMSEHVFFTGQVDDLTLRSIYQRVALFAMPSRAEGFGIVYLEAMRHRLACIGSIHDAAREIIVDGETGFLVDQNDTEALAARISQLLTDQGLRLQFGYRGFERLHAEFSLEKFQARMSELLAKLAA